jgi:hypothetical protein
MARICALFFCALGATALIGCFGVAPGKASYNLVGVWFGTLGVSCVGSCLREPEISFTLFQQQAGISGFYRCWWGSNECRDPDEGGSVTIPDPQSAPLLIRVTSKEGSRCLFQGLPYGDEIEGGRICFSSRGSISNGRWRVQRAY